MLCHERAEVQGSPFGIEGRPLKEEERFQLGEMFGSGGGCVLGRRYSIIGKVMQIGITLGELCSLVRLVCRVYIGNDEKEGWEYKWN